MTVFEAGVGLEFLEEEASVEPESWKRLGKAWGWGTLVVSGWGALCDTPEHGCLCSPDFTAGEFAFAPSPS